jgi:hypothetical protein
LRATTCIIGASLFMAVSGSRISAQQIQGALSVSGGSATDVRGVTSRAVTLTPSMSVAPDPRALFALEASATRFDNSQWSAGGGGAMALRAPLGRYAAFTLNAGGNATTTSYDFSYLTANAIPALEVTAGAVSAYAGARGGLASTSTVQESAGPSGPFGSNPLASRSTTSVSRTTRGVLFGANARFSGAAGETLIAGVREEHATVDTMPTIDRSASISVLNGRVTIGGSFGVRSEPSARTTFGSGALSIAVGPAMSIELGAGSYPSNRLVGTPAGRYLNLGLSLSTGRALPGQPVPDGPAPRSGMTRVSIRAERATRVEVAGDFTNWKPIAAQRASNGVWFIDLRIPPGQYRYAFRVDGSAWQVPEGATVVDDDFGGKSAWLVVSAPSNPAR